MERIWKKQGEKTYGWDPIIHQLYIYWCIICTSIDVQKVQKVEALLMSSSACPPACTRLSAPQHQGLRSWVPPYVPWIKNPEFTGLPGTSQSTVIQRDIGPQVAWRVPGDTGSVSACCVTMGKPPPLLDCDFHTSKENIQCLVPSDPQG